MIINADFMQVYRDLRIITARPTLEEEARVPHRLYGHVDAAVNYLGRRLGRRCREDVSEAQAQDRLPIFIGGSGPYFKALTRGPSAVPPIPAEVRERVAHGWSATVSRRCMPNWSSAIRSPPSA